MKSIGREIVRLCCIVTVLLGNVLLAQIDSSEYIDGSYENLWRWLMQKDDTISFNDKFLRVLQFYDSLDQIEIARYDIIYKAEQDSLDYCDPNVEQFYDGCTSIEARWIDSISCSCLWVRFEPRFIPPTPYILTVDKQRYNMDLHWLYWDNVYDNKRYTGVFVVCFDKCLTDTKKILITAFIPYTNYVAQLVLE